MKSILFAFAILTTAQASYAANCQFVPPAQVASDGAEAWIVVQDGTSLRPPVVREIHDAMNNDPSLMASFNQTQFWIDDGQGSYVEPKPAFKSIAKNGTNDPACKDKKITGYQCRDNQLKSATFGVTLGIEAPVWAKLPVSEIALLQSIVSRMNCAQ